MRYVLVLILIALGACSRKAVPEITRSEHRDSTVIQYVPRIEIVKIPGDTVTIERFIECEDNKPKPVKIRAQSKRAKVVAEIKPDGKLILTGGCDSLEQVVTVLDKEIYRLRHDSEFKQIPTFRTRKIDIWCRWIAGSSILLLALAIILWVKKKLQFF